MGVCLDYIHVPVLIWNYSTGITYLYRNQGIVGGFQAAGHYYDQEATINKIMVYVSVISRKFCKH